MLTTRALSPRAETAATRKTYLPFGQPNFSQLEIDAVTRVMRSGWIGMGPETLAFEEELARYTGAPHVVTVNSCTSALFLSLLAAGVGPGDEVIVPSLTWCSSANAALYLGARPVFCDVDADTLGANLESVAACVGPRTRAVVVVHFGGYALDVKALRAALPGRVAIVEDAAHAFGARHPDGSPVGSSGNSVCFSFYANKNLSTAEGGAVALADEEAADRLKSLRQHALPVNAWMRFTHARSVFLAGQLSELGYKMNYTDLQACLGRAQLQRFPELQERRAEVARHYVERLRRERPDVALQAGIADDRHARHLFVVQLPLERMTLTRDELLLALRERNLGATVHYQPLHLMPLYAESRPPKGLPVTERLAPRIMTLPISANMSVADAEEVTDHLLALLD
jgi:dTDP-4-amino-4,6-dideoxygalactose transaminase